MINLLDFTFNIPIKADSADRAENFITFFEYMTAICQTNYIVYENDSTAKCKVLENKYNFKHKLINEELFHRTKFLNQMALESDTPFIVNCDIDCLISEKQYEDAAINLRAGKLDGCNPFTGYTRNVKKEAHSKIRKYKNLSCIDDNDFKTPNELEVTYGCIVMWNKKKFMEIGMENERFLSWGPEDYERAHRAKKLELNFGRVEGEVYHLDHHRSQNSNNSNPYFKHNLIQYAITRCLNKEELQDYITTWEWLK